MYILNVKTQKGGKNHFKKFFLKTRAQFKKKFLKQKSSSSAT